MYNLFSDLWSVTDDMQGSLIRAIELERENKKLKLENKELKKKLSEAHRTIASLEPLRFNQDLIIPSSVVEGSFDSSILQDNDFSNSYDYEAEVKIETTEEKETNITEVTDESFYERILSTLACDGLQCPLCFQRFTKRSSTVRHLIRQHGLEEERIKIRTYKRSFSFSKLGP